MIQMAKKLAIKINQQSFEGLLGSFGVLLSSNAIIAGLSFLSLAFFSQALGAAGLGLLVLVETYGKLFDQVLRLEPTQMLIQQATPYRDTPSAQPFRRLVRFSFLIDLGGSTFAALLALLCLPFAGAWFGFDAAILPYVIAYCLTNFIPAPMTAMGLFRLFGQIQTYARLMVLNAVLRCVGAAVLLWVGAGLEAFLVLICLGSLVQRVLPTLVLWPVLRRRAGADFWQVSVRGVLAEGTHIWRFILAANLNVLARNSTRQFDLAVLAGMVGAAEIGLYILAKRFAMLVIKLGAPIQIAAYPRICELVNQTEILRVRRFVRLFLVTFLSLSACGIAIFAIIGGWLISVTFGPEFEAATHLVLIQLVGAAFLLSGAIFNCVLQALRREGRLMMVSILASAAFFLPIPFVVPAFGVTGASLLYVLMGAVWFTGCSLVYAKAIRAAV